MNNTVMFKEIIGQGNNIKDCFDYNCNTLKELGQIINNFNPTNIIITARGTSMHSSVYAKYLFEIYYGIPTSLAAPSVFTAYDSNVDMSKTLVIAISQSGKANDVLKVIEAANANGALTISITNTPNSIVAKASKYHLHCNVGEAISFAATKTFTSTMYLVTKLMYYITENNDLNIDENKLIETINTTLKKHDDILQLVKDLKNIEDLFVLSRGIPLVLAMEMALKIKETSHFHVSSYPISEFYHGPIAMLNDKTPVIILALDKHINKDVKQFLLDTKELNIYSLIITNDNTIQGTKNIMVNEDNDIYALFSAIIILQLYACELSVLRGNNPDYLKILELNKPI